MAEHRVSYWKTASGVAAVVLADAAAIVWLILRAAQSWPSLPIALTWGAGSLLLFLEFAAVLVLTGALICLRRDGLESRGLPYVGRPREWHAGIIVRGYRGLLRSLRAASRNLPGQLALHAGEVVEIRSREEIFATLDSKGELDFLPFMPEMESLCGQQARVFRRVDKIFDWITSSGLRRMRDTVILEGLRCDGSSHGGCQADCPFLWKEAWLRRASAKGINSVAQQSSKCGQLDLQHYTTRIDAETAETRFVCQLCKLPEATTPTSWNSPRNLLRELFSGNARISAFLTFVSITAFNAVQRRCGGARFPILAHSQSPTSPHVVLDLQPGELVRIKPKHEIEQTLNAQFKNRGLWFDKEMTRFCGGTHKVLARAKRQIDERTGKMVTFATPCIALEGVTATGEYFEFAPLDERIYWREIWLERVTKENGVGVHSDGESARSQERVPALPSRHPETLRHIVIR